MLLIACCSIWRVFPQELSLGLMGRGEGQERLVEYPSDLNVPWGARCLCGPRCGWHQKHCMSCGLASRFGLAASRVLPPYCLHGYTCDARNDIFPRSCAVSFSLPHGFSHTCHHILDLSHEKLSCSKFQGICY